MQDAKVTSDSKTLHLENHLVYHVQVRRKATGYSLWSEWSRLVEFPVVSDNGTGTDRMTHGGHHCSQNVPNRGYGVSQAPPPEASYGGVTYHLSLKLPCEIKNKSTTNTSYRMKVTVSEARVSIIAKNNVSESASREIIIPHVQHLKKACPKQSKRLQEKKRRKNFCLEWYKLPDGETRPIQVNTSRNATAESIKKAPVAEPQNVTVVNVIHDSALLLWRPIPVQDQRGFLLSYMIWILREGGKTVLAKVLLSVGGVVLLLSVVFSIAFRRFKKKILPMIPSPVIPATASYHLPQNLRATTEEVHDVILLYREDLDKQNKAHVEQSTLLQDCQLSVCEEEDEEEEGDEEQFISSFPNPNYKGQMLRLPEPLAEEKDPKENNSEISTPSYRHVSVL
ncbi:hypothetical protein NFI96_000730 [Prochilodus magdalenae]|nr:hypothetical protein NFI96_000730 [Prochilodus magdalenae]